MPKKAEKEKETTEPRGLKTETRRVKIQLLRDMLGTVPKDKEVYKTYIAGKAKSLSPDEVQEEVDTVEDIEAKGWTGFHRDKKGNLFIYDYMIKGFFKEALESCVAAGALNKIPAYKKWIDHLVFIKPRQIYLNVKEPDGDLERPLRTMTPKGERVTLARSDFLQAGRTLEFEVMLLPNTKGITWDILETVFGYGQLVGLGQWRGSGGYGAFEVVKMTAMKKSKL